MSNRLSFLHILAALLLILYPGHARTKPVSSNDQERISFEHIPSPNFGIINCIIRDDRGFLWFGTTKGLCRYDGYQVRVLSVGNDLPLSGNVPGHDRQVVTSMIRMNDGSILLGADLGLWLFNPASEQFAPVQWDSASAADRITALVRDTGNVVWIGTVTRGVFRFDLRTHIIQAYSMRQGLSDNWITSLLIDHDRRLWVGTGNGGLNLIDLSGRILRHYIRKSQEQCSLFSDHITALCEKDERELWIGTEDGLNVLDMQSGQLRCIQLPSPRRHTVYSLATDPDKRVWIAASELGLFSFAAGELKQFTSSGDLERSLGSVTAVYTDPVASNRSGLLLWIGTRNGCDKVLITRNPFSNYIRDRNLVPLSRGAVLSVCEDHLGVLWVALWGGGVNGLRQMNGNYQRIYAFSSSEKSRLSLPNDDINAVIEDHRGNLWIGTKNGLAVLDSMRTHVSIINHLDGDSTSLAGNAVNTIHEDREGGIWISTEAGLSKLIDERHHRFRNFLNNPNDARAFGGNFVSDITEDHADRLWVGTYGRGINRLEPNGRFTRFLDASDSTFNRENFIYTLVESRDGMFWLSTRAGLVLFDPRAETFVHHQIDQLHDAHIHGIFPDESNGLWLSTSIGLTKYNPRSNAVTRFGNEQGLLFNECFSRFYRSKRGMLFVGGIDGFAQFDVTDLTAHAQPPEIAITTFKVLNREIPSAGTLPDTYVLPYNQNVLSFSFAALDYSDPLHNRFTYMMEGIDPQWVDAGTRNSASYANLQPGSYVFRVRGCNSDNIWNETGTSIAIIITPPYWQTWWFRILISAALAGAILLAYRYRLRKLLEMERLRLRIANDLHDDVGSNLSVIAMASRSAQRAPELSQTTKGKLDEIYDTAITTAEGMKDIVWFIKPKGDALNDLLLRMKETAASLLGDIEYTFQGPGSETSPRISIDFKRNFFLAYKEILTNVVKHADASDVRIQLTCQDSMLEMVIQDNGRGFQQSTVRHGNGLASLHERAANLSGQCEIETLPGKGTMVRFCGHL